jgi:hypothetical protein
LNNNNNNNNNNINNNKEQTCLVIDIAIPDDSNFNKKDPDKQNKYKDLEIEISRMWKVRTKIVPVTIGAVGTIIRD